MYTGFCFGRTGFEYTACIISRSSGSVSNGELGERGDRGDCGGDRCICCICCISGFSGFSGFSGVSNRDGNCFSSNGNDGKVESVLSGNDNVGNVGNDGNDDNSVSVLDDDEGENLGEIGSVFIVTLFRLVCCKYSKSGNVPKSIVNEELERLFIYWCSKKSK